MCVHTNSHTHTNAQHTYLDTHTDTHILRTRTSLWYLAWNCAGTVAYQLWDVLLAEAATSPLLHHRIAADCRMSAACRLLQHRLFSFYHRAQVKLASRGLST